MLFRRQGSAWLDFVSTVGGAPLRVRLDGQWSGTGDVVYDNTDDTTVDFIWTGAQSEDGIVVSTKLAVPDGTVARLAVSPHEDFSADVQFGPEAEVAGGLVKLGAGGLDADAQYHCAVRVEDTVYLKKRGRFRTLPPAGQATSFVLTFGSCSNISYQTDSFARMQARDPIAFIHLGDWLYPNYTGTDATQWFDKIAAAFGDPVRSEMHRQVPTYFIWDDHDFGSNDSYGLKEDGTPVPFRQSRLDGYRQFVPHPDLASEGAESAIYYCVDFGRVRLVVCDGRSTRHPKSKSDDGTKSMLGAEQVAWLKTQFDWLDANPDHAMVWANTMPWIESTTAGSDAWGGYSAERDDLVDYFTGVTGPGDVSGRIVMISGDAHMLAYDNGNNAPGRIRVCHAAPLGNSTSQKGGPYSGGKVTASTLQYGILSVEDVDGTISFSFSGRRADTDAEVITSGRVVLGPQPGPPEPEIVYVESFEDDSDLEHWTITSGGDEIPWAVVNTHMDGDPVPGALKFGGEGQSFAVARRAVAVEPGSAYVVTSVQRHTRGASSAQARVEVSLMTNSESTFWTRDFSAGTNADRTLTIDVFDGNPIPSEAAFLNLVYQLRGPGYADRMLEIGHVEVAKMVSK